MAWISTVRKTKKIIDMLFPICLALFCIVEATSISQQKQQTVVASTTNLEAEDENQPLTLEIPENAKSMTAEQVGDQVQSWNVSLFQVFPDDEMAGIGILPRRNTSTTGQACRSCRLPGSSTGPYA
jgi:hypothetical protein